MNKVTFLWDNIVTWYSLWYPLHFTITNIFRLSFFMWWRCNLLRVFIKSSQRSHSLSFLVSISLSLSFPLSLSTHFNSFSLSSPSPSPSPSFDKKIARFCAKLCCQLVPTISCGLRVSFVRICVFQHLCVISRDLTWNFCSKEAINLYPLYQYKMVSKMDSLRPCYPIFKSNFNLRLL